MEVDKLQVEPPVGAGLTPDGGRSRSASVGSIGGSMGGSFGRRMLAPVRRRLRWVDGLQLLVISCLPFGGHFVKNCLSSLQPYLMAPEIGFTQTNYGMLLALYNLPNLFLPLVGAALMSATRPGPRMFLVLFPVMVLFGQIVVTVGAAMGSLYVAGIGCLLVGSGSGCSVMAQRSMVASMYEGKSLTFALGVTVSTAALSKTIARSSMAIIAARSGGDVPLSLSFTLLPCLFSVIAGAVYGYIWASCGGSPETSTPLVLPSVGRSIAAAHLHSCRSPREELLDAIVRNLPVHKRQSSGQPSEEEDGDEETPLLQPAGSDPNPRGGAATAGGALSKSYGGYGSVQSSSHGRENSMCEEPERESAFEKACPDTYQRGVMLVLALVLLHGLIVNAFHLFAQFAVPILKRRNGFSIRVAGLVSSLATCMPVVGAPITGLVLDQFMGRVTMETVCFMCTAMTATFAVLYMMPSLSPLPIMITFSAVEAVLPTAVMALLPMGVALASPDAYASPAEQASRSSGCWGRQNVNMHWAYAAVEVVDAGIAMVGSIGMGGILEKTEKFGVGAAALLSVSACAALLSYAVWGASPTIESALQPEEYELLTPRQAKPRHDDHSRPALRATELHV